jgi:hypothetical protein
MLMKDFKLSLSQFGSFEMFVVLLVNLKDRIMNPNLALKPCVGEQVIFGENGMCLILGGNWKLFPY